MLDLDEREAVPLLLRLLGLVAGNFNLGCVLRRLRGEVAERERLLRTEGIILHPERRFKDDAFLRAGGSDLVDDIVHDVAEFRALQPERHLLARSIH